MRSLLAVLALLLAGSASAATCGKVVNGAESYSVCTVRADEDLRLVLMAPDGQPYGAFDRLRTALEADGKRLLFAMNGGMYHSDRSPVGLFIENGNQKTRLVTREGPGNFGLLPNGVFCIGAKSFSVVESRRFLARPVSCRFATQSGPMLVIGGKLHPKFRKSSDSLNIRNGVGVSADGRTAYFAISDRPVNFWDFALLFRDKLKVPQALYLDGSISRLYAPDLGRDDPGRRMGPILALVGG